MAVFGSDIKTLKEQGIDVELANWRGIVALPGRPGENQALDLRNRAKAGNDCDGSGAWRAPAVAAPSLTI